MAKIINPCPLCGKTNVEIIRSSNCYGQGFNVSNVEIRCPDTNNCGLNITRDEFNSAITDDEMIDAWNKL